MDAQDKKKALEEEIIADARRKAERIISRAEREAKKIIEDAEKGAKRHADEIKKEALERAETEFRKLTAALAALKERRMLIVREKVIEDIMDEALRKTREKFDQSPREYIKQLLLNAVLDMPEDEMTIETNERDKSLIDGDLIAEITEEVRNRQGRTVKLELSNNPARISGGVIVRAKSGRAIYDNSFEERHRRLRDTLRVRLAKLLFPEEE